ncbi:TPA: glycosyltransferase [Candidatus Woesearchaeota archaeon]|nr:glycosyltransferase [Candidatus Woesearchaeota archaeon]
MEVLAIVLEQQQILFISTFPPRECGIATFTKDLTTAFDRQFNPLTKSKILAINNGSTQELEYPEDVIFQLTDSDIEAYSRVAKSINESRAIKLVHIQHDFGIFGGEYEGASSEYPLPGSHLTEFLKVIEKPLVITFHSILPDPIPGLKRAVQSLAEKAACIVVMTNMGADILRNVYGLKNDIRVIPHGIPNVAFKPSRGFKKQLGYEGRTILSSFGTMNRCKGYEYVLDALPSVVKRFPDVLYLMVGTTLPSVKKEEGEMYRYFLESRVRELGLQKNVLFHNQYVSMNELTGFLQATDICLSTDLDPGQITSSTLAYALGCGRAVISTPFIHAKDIVSLERGILVNFKDSKAYAKAITRLLSDEKLRRSMERNAYQYSRQMTWPEVAKAHERLYRQLLRRERSCSEEPLGEAKVREIITKLPLELEAEPSDINFEEMSLPEGWDRLSESSLIFFIVGDLSKKGFGKAISLAYQFSYLRQLSQEDKQRVFEELETIKGETYTGLLRKYHEKSLEEEVAAVTEFLKLSERERDELYYYIKLRDRVISYARAIRIATELMHHYREHYSDLSLTNLKQVIEKLLADYGACNVVFGFTAMGRLKDGFWKKDDIRILRELLWLLAQLEGKLLNVLNLPNKEVLVYDENEMRRILTEREGEAIHSKEHIEHLIKVNLLKSKSGQYSLSEANGEGDVSYFNSIIRSVVFEARDQRFTRWNSQKHIWRSGGLGRRVWMLTKCVLEAKAINTKDRPYPVKDQLEVELENQAIFNQQLPIYVIDDESKDSNCRMYTKHIKELKERYGNQIRFISGSEKVANIREFTSILARVYQELIKQGKIDNCAADILYETKKGKKQNDEYRIVSEGRVSQENLLRYLRENALYHISGIRNYTILLLTAQGRNNYMNFDDDAPAETYCLLPQDRERVIESRLKARKRLMKDLMQRVAEKTGKAIRNELQLYKVWVEHRTELYDLEKEFFSYSEDGKKGLIPQAMEEIIPLSGPRRCRFGGQGIEVSSECSSFDENRVLTHQRYQGLMFPLPEHNLVISDFVYPEPRLEKKDCGFVVIPVNVMGGARLLGKKAKDAVSMYMKHDLRGTMGLPADKADAAFIKDATIAYVPFPFVLDQDTSALFQFKSWINMPKKEIANIQHTNRTALIVTNIRSFAGNTNVIFNRSVLDIRSPTPSIGQTLRLEEQPYVVWIKRPLSKKTITVCFSPVGGAHQRTISSRFYMIPFQDFNEVVGTLGKEFYEQAVSRFYRKAEENPELYSPYSRDTYHLLGSSYIEVAKELEREDLREGRSKRLLEERRYRAILLSRLALQRAEKAIQSETMQESREKQKMLREVYDMDLILVRYADNFWLYKARNIENRERTNEDDDHSPLTDADYFYRIIREGNTLHWKKVKPLIRLGEREDVTNPAPIQSSWNAFGKGGIIEINPWQQNKELVFEAGRRVVLETLPREGVAIIVPSLVDGYESNYLNEVEELLHSQIKQDGETIYIWPDIVDAAKYAESKRIISIVQLNPAS